LFRKDEVSLGEPVHGELLIKRLMVSEANRDKLSPTVGLEREGDFGFKVLLRRFPGQRCVRSMTVVIILELREF
jgi:hypothetical protein